MQTKLRRLENSLESVCSTSTLTTVKNPTENYGNIDNDVILWHKLRMK